MKTHSLNFTSRRLPGLVKLFVAAIFLLSGVTDVMAVEEAKYEVITKNEQFEVRDYAPHVLAEIIVEADFEDAGDEAFNRLFRYITGDNQSRTRVAMTAPVSQEARGEEIEMTAPVGQQHTEQGWAVSFMMPDTYTLKTLPVPDDSSIKLRQVPARRMAAVTYSGFWSENSYLKNKAALEAWIENNGYSISGSPVWARYNPPFMPWFMRRNEILIPIDAAAPVGSSLDEPPTKGTGNTGNL